MDHLNRFESPLTYRMLRAEFAVALAVSIGYFLAHITEINWWAAVVLFVYIDLVGYIPGAIAYRRTAGGDISKVYYVLYDVMHSFVTQAAVVGLWIWIAGPEWALLAIPIHLCGDRALFGNFPKPFAVPFEPLALPAWLEFDRKVFGRSSEHAGHRPTPERI